MQALFLHRRELPVMPADSDPQGRPRRGIAEGAWVSELRLLHDVRSRTPNTRACMTSATQRCLHREGTIRMREGTDPAAYGQQAMIGAVRTLRLTPHPSSCQPAFIGGFSLGGSLTSSSSGCGTSSGLGSGTS